MISSWMIFLMTSKDYIHVICLDAHEHEPPLIFKVQQLKPSALIHLPDPHESQSVLLVLPYIILSNSMDYSNLYIV